MCQCVCVCVCVCGCECVSVHAIYMPVIPPSLPPSPADYEFVPAPPSYTVQEGSSVVVCFQNQNPTENSLEFDFTVTLMTEDGEATGPDYRDI